MDAVQPHVQNTENAPIEETEANYPVLYRRYALEADSEGAGRWRGGLGLRRDYVFEGPVAFSIMTERVRFAPQGLLGGGPARSNYFIRDPDGDAERLPSKFTVDLPAGGVFSVQTAGGGGFGPVAERDPDAVRHDVWSERISAGRARDVYGLDGPSPE
jgi:N-methylhydantoinase B